MGGVLLRSAALVAVLLCGSAFPQLPLERAVTLTREKRYAESAEILRGVPEPRDVPQRIAFHRLKAANASGTGDHAAAAGEMSRALALAPSDPNLLAATALAELQAGLPQDARRHAQQSSKLLPQSAKIRTLLGIAHYSAGYSAEAVSTLTAAIDLDPAEEPAYRCLSQIVLQSSVSPPPAATAHLCRWNATVCSALKLRLARETGDQTMQAEAIAVLKRAPPDDPVGRCELARAWEWTGRLPEARTEMETCLKLAPTPQNHYRMGVIYKRLGLDDLARKEMEARKQLIETGSEQDGLSLTLRP